LAEELTKVGGIVEQVVVYESVDVEAADPETAARLARAATQLGRAATAHAVEVATVAAADGLDAFGSEVEPKVKVEVRPAVAPAKPKAGAPAVQAAVVAKWLVVILLSAGIAVAGLIGYQRRSTVLHAGIRRGRA